VAFRFSVDRKPSLMPPLLLRSEMEPEPCFGKITGWPVVLSSKFDSGLWMD
jgi:hypothetical protein